MPPESFSQLFAATPNFSGLDIGLLPLSVIAAAGKGDDAQR